MRRTSRHLASVAALLSCVLPLLTLASTSANAQDATSPNAAATTAPAAAAGPAIPAATPAPAPATVAPNPAARIDGTGLGWVALGETDFTNVNCDPETWSFPNGQIHCTGNPVGVIRTKKEYRNLELVVEWRHLKPAGNSGVFLWASEKNLASLKRGGLPEGIEVQILDHGYSENYRKQTGKEPDWFTTHGDVFPTGAARMTPFPPVAPNGSRSFPRKNLSKASPEWNHYYVRAVNGEVRLWVNGEEVSGGTGCAPASGFLCLESEGSPIEFRNLKVRELP